MKQVFWVDLSRWQTMNRLYYQNGIWCSIHWAYVIVNVLFLFNINVLFTGGRGKKTTWERKLQKIISPHPHPLWSSGVAVKDNNWDWFDSSRTRLENKELTWKPWGIVDETTGTWIVAVSYFHQDLIFFFFGIFGLENLALKTFRRNMDNLIFYLAKMALVLAFLATTPTRGRKEDESLKMCF